MRVHGHPPTSHQGRGAEGIEFGGDKHPGPIGEDGFGAARQGNDVACKRTGIPGLDVVAKGCSRRRTPWSSHLLKSTTLTGGGVSIDANSI